MMEFYFGRDQLVPVASILATIVGLLLIFWGKLVGLLRRVIGHPRRSSEEAKIARAAGKQPTQQP